MSKTNDGSLLCYFVDLKRWARGKHQTKIQRDIQTIFRFFFLLLSFGMRHSKIFFFSFFSCVTHRNMYAILLSLTVVIAQPFMPWMRHIDITGHKEKIIGRRNGSQKRWKKKTAHVRNCHGEYNKVQATAKNKKKWFISHTQSHESNHSCISFTVCGFISMETWTVSLKWALLKNLMTMIHLLSFCQTFQHASPFFDDRI